jgi:hypothetical protein
MVITPGSPFESGMGDVLSAARRAGQKSPKSDAEEYKLAMQRWEEETKAFNRDVVEKGFPVPEITDNMKQELIIAIGEESLKKYPQYHPDNLHPYYASRTPSYELGGINFEATGPRKNTWEEAWDRLKKGIAHLKQEGIL